jgi:hypothetical protein
MHLSRTSGIIDQRRKNHTELPPTELGQEIRPALVHTVNSSTKQLNQFYWRWYTSAPFLE